MRKTGGSKQDLLQLMLNARMRNEDISKMKMANLEIDMNSGNEGEKGEQEQEVKAIKNGKSSASMKALDENEVIANAIIFYEAGFETTSTMLGFVLHILVNHQDIQERIREEVQQLWEEEGRFDYNTVNQCVYMQAVINETMRFYPPVTAFVTRHAQSDYKYKNITIPKGANVQIPTYQLHHNESYWPEVRLSENALLWYALF